MKLPRSLAGILIIYGAFHIAGSKINTTLTCEGQKAWLKCNKYELIRIKSAFWGRDDNVTCPMAPAGLTINNFCKINKVNTIGKVDGKCKNQQSCEVDATNVFFNDNSCRNTYKYLKIGYECVPDDMNGGDVLKQGGKRRKRKRAVKEKRHAEMLREQEKQKRHV